MLSIFVVILALLSQCSSQSTSTILTSADRTRLQQVLEPGWKLTDLSMVMYAASGYKHLGLTVPAAKAACSYASSFTSSGTPNTETIFQAVSTAQYLGCPITASAQIKQTLQSSISDSSSMQELYHAVLAMSRSGIKIDSAKILPIVQTVLNKDDEIVLNFGYAFHIASLLTGDVSSVYDRIEDIIVQADEIGGNMLQFEGGLSITALVIDGAYKLSETAKKAVPIQPEQAVKFANYLLSRKTVPLAKGVHYLLHALTMFTNNKNHIPVSMSLASSVSVSSSQPKVQVSVSDVLGNAINGAGSITVSATTQPKDSNKKATPTTVSVTPVKNSKTLYEFDAMAKKPERGFYTLTFTINTSDKRIIGTTQKLTFKVLSSVSVEKVEFGTVDADQSQAAVLKKIAYGSKLAGGPLEADRHQKVVLRFAVKDTASGTTCEVHQAFVRFSVKDREIIFLADVSDNMMYKFEMSVGEQVKAFKGMSGVYAVELLLGDASISNPMKWHLADVKLNFPQSKAADDTVDFTYKQAKPEIEHQFQVADKRPSQLLSTTFTALCVAPLLVLLGLWCKLGANIKGFSFSLTTLGFHLGVGAIFALYCCFWLKLNMFTTLRYLFMIGVVTFYCGNSMLSRIASSRKESSK